MQGPSVVRPYTEKFGITFPVAVDAADVFGEAFGLKAIPVTYLVDEVGIIRLKGGGPGPALLKEIEDVLNEPLTTVRAAAADLPAARTEAELKQALAVNGNDWKARLALAQLYNQRDRFEAALEQLEDAAKIRPAEAAISFTWGLVLLHQDRKEAALVKLKGARDLDPENWRIRKQIWALEHPDKFYTGDTPDYGWQREELAREKSKP